MESLSATCSRTLRSLLFFSLLGLPRWGAGQPENIPASLRALLDQKYPGWTWSSVNRDAMRVFQEAGWPGTPTCAWGDFDGDGKTDYAVQVTYPASDGARESDLIYLQRGDAYREYVLRERTPGDRRSIYFLRLIRAGEKTTNSEGRPIRHRTDAVEMVSFAQESRAYFYNKRADRFRSILTLRLKGR